MAKTAGFESRWEFGYSSLVFVVCCLGSDLWDKPTTRSKESYRMCINFVWSQNLNIELKKARDGLLHNWGGRGNPYTDPFKKILTFPKTNANWCQRVRNDWLRHFTSTYIVYNKWGAHGSAVGWGTALQVGRSRVRFLMVSLEFFIDNPGPAMTLGLTDSLTETNTRNISWG